MIIRITFDETIHSLAIDQELQETVFELLRAHRRGSHLVVADREVVAWLLRNVEFAKAETALLKRLSQSYAQNGSLHLQSSHYIQVNFSSDKIYVKGPEISYPLRLIGKTKIADPPLLLVENIENDGWMYEFILSNLRKNFGVSDICIELSNGGGSSISSVFEYHQRQRRIVFAIVDSDKKSPSCKKDEKLAQLETARGRSDWPLGFSKSLPCKELENLIPHPIFVILPQGNMHQSNHIIDDICSVEKQKGIPLRDCYWNYFDIKVGFNQEIRTKYSDEDLQWISEKLSIAKKTIDDNIAGYGDRAVAQLRTSTDAQVAFREQIRSARWQESYRSFFASIAWAFVSASPLRT